MRMTLVAALTIFVWATPARGAVIPLSAFSNPIVEGFENVIGISLPGSPQSFGTSAKPPLGFRFSSGLTLLAPDPATTFQGLTVGDYRIRTPGPIFPFFSLGAGGDFRSPADLHGGTAFATYAADAIGPRIPALRFGFAQPVSRVGLFVSTWQSQKSDPRDPITLSIFDTSGNLIESDVFTDVPAPPLRDANFIGVASAIPIGSFMLSTPTPYYAFDDVMFEVAAAVPEPSTLIMLGLGAVGWTGSRWRQRKRLSRHL